MAANREQLYIAEARKHAKALWQAYLALQALQAEWNALDYGNTLDAGTGPNAEISRADVSNVVFTTTNALTTLFGQGHGTNIAKLL